MVVSKQNIIGQIFLALLGILTFFMPWIHYPILKDSLRGYHGDGYILSSLFLIILNGCVIAFLRQKKGIFKIVKVMNIAISLLLTYIVINKFRKFQIDVSNFVPSDALTGYASSGARISYGLHIILIVSILILLLCLLPKFFSSTQNVIGLLMIAFATYGIINYISLSAGASIVKEPSQVHQSIEDSFNRMNQHLFDKNFEGFVQLTHPTVRNSVGGDVELASVLQDLYNQINVKSIKIDSIEPILRKGKLIQAIVHQSSTFEKNGEVSTSQSKTIAFSYNKGQDWVFAGMDNKNKAELLTSFPEIFQELDF